MHSLDSKPCNRIARGVGLVCVLLAGCQSRSKLDSSRLTITPGIGISNIVELGMSMEQIGQRTRDLKIEKAVLVPVDVSVVSVPSLGAHWEQLSEDERLVGVYFDIASFGPGRPRFRGKILGGISFVDGEAVTREMITGVWGSPDHSILWSQPASQEQIRDMTSWSASGTSYVVQFVSHPETEVLFYPAEGMSLTLESNNVTMVNIFYSGKTWPLQSTRWAIDTNTNEATTGMARRERSGPEN